VVTRSVLMNGLTSTVDGHSENITPLLAVSGGKSIIKSGIKHSHTVKNISSAVHNVPTFIRRIVGSNFLKLFAQLLPSFTRLR